MTVQFTNNRIVLYVVTFLLSATVLGLSAHFASVFLPRLHQDFTIFALIISSLTIFTFLITLQWAQPRTEAPVLFILGALWLAMGAWSTDVIGNVQCDGLAGQRTATKNGDMSAQAFCREMKVIQAFSWMLFVLLWVSFVILLALVSQAQRFGRWRIWDEPIRELGWFGEMPGYYNQGSGTPGAYPQQYMPYGNGYPMFPQQPMFQQQPGQSIIIQPSANGGAPTVTTVPHS
ncbi:hypothetical protein HGRIS_010022 [Hohenbuehelia grisea]|uniref:MARVEL domain-containing protein n=1 Tax=Hohenbuehelia grisea TaxID=104357 RepID=A0ABR3J2Z1_9AGAR